eukprot:6180470-Ditylum_brightwellii.AAC.1
MYKASPDAAKSVTDLMDNFNAQTSSWAKCFRSIRAIEANIPAEEDLYLPNEISRNAKWVNGPNRQFSAAVHSITSGAFNEYDVMFVMEGDCVPVKEYWLEALLEEAEESFGVFGPFAILGRFRTSLPLSLQHHINGNALYNISHPLFLNLLSQLESEKDTIYNTIPYDYRMSQILVEGMLGVLPEIPPLLTKDLETNKEQFPHNSNTNKFRKWWEKYGTNLSPRHLINERAFVLHGAKQYLAWDKGRH